MHFLAAVTALALVAGYAAAADCDAQLTNLCGSCTSGDVKCLIDCLEANDASFRQTGCQLADEALTIFRMARDEPEKLAEAMRQSELAAIVRPENLGPARMDFAIVESDKPPTVFAHGMGDSCFNGGMQQITADTGAHIGSYAVCIPTGDNEVWDTINGFILNMDKSVDVFAAKIRNDTKLANGFNAVGFSQGNSLIRGYIHKYNDPPVLNVLHVHGTVSGVSGFPQCNPAGIFSFICEGIAHLCGDLSYNSLVQGILFQADYFRDPTKTTTDAYRQYSQLAQWNNEGESSNSTYKSNFISVNKFVMVKALGDTMVFPNEGEHWGHFADDTSGKYTVLQMNQTKWFQNDMFGLRTAAEAGKIHFEETEGNHLQFTEKQLFGWVDKYF